MPKRLILTSVVLALCSGSGQADPPMTAQQLADAVGQLRREVEELKSQVRDLKSRGGTAGGTGLRTVDLKNQTVGGSPGASQPPQLTPEQQQELMKQVEAIKKAAQERDKALKDLEEGK